MSEKIKVLLLIPHLGGGGAERVTALLARHLDPTRFEIHLALITPDASKTEFIPESVNVHCLNKKRVRQAWLSLLNLVRTQRPSIVLSNMAHLNFLVILLKPFMPRRTKVLIRQNTTASSSNPNRLTSQLYRYLYPKADAILCQTQAMANDLATHFAIPREKLKILPNPIEPAITGIRSNQILPWFDQTHPRILTVGRLSPEKGLDLFIHAMAVIRHHHPKLQFAILGVGLEEARLRSLVWKLGLNNAVIFAGHTDPSCYQGDATLYVQPSRHEGLPNALLEAAAAGLPIVSTQSSQGLVDLLQNAEGTWLTPAITAEALAETILNALKSLSTQPPRYQHKFLAPFELKTAIHGYETLLQQCEASGHQPKLALILPTIDQIGGAERQVLLIAHELASRKWHVTVITLSGTGGTESAKLINHGIEYLSLQMRKAWIDPRGWLRYLEWHRQNRPGITHAHLSHATWFARCVRLLAPVPVHIDTIHTSSTGSPARKLGYRLTHWLTTHVTCVSQSVAQAALAGRMATPRKLVILHNGVPLHLCQNPEAAAGSFRWIAVGRLAPVKDYSTLLRAFAALPYHATLTVVGTGPEEPNLRGLAITLNIQDRIHFAGFQTDIQPWLARADAFVLASLWEGLPVSVLEASAASLPIVATNAAGTSEAMIPGETGLLVPVADPAALANAMRQVMALSPEARKFIGDRGRLLIEEKFSLSAVTTQWEQLYARLLRENPEPIRHGMANQPNRRSRSTGELPPPPVQSNLPH